MKSIYRSANAQTSFSAERTSIVCYYGRYSDSASSYSPAFPKQKCFSDIIGLLSTIQQRDCCGFSPHSLFSVPLRTHRNFLFTFCFTEISAKFETNIPYHIYHVKSIHLFNKTTYYHKRQLFTICTETKSTPAILPWCCPPAAPPDIPNPPQHPKRCSSPA